MSLGTSINWFSLLPSHSSTSLLLYRYPTLRFRFGNRVTDVLLVSSWGSHESGTKVYPLSSRTGQEGVTVRPLSKSTGIVESVYT